VESPIAEIQYSLESLQVAKSAKSPNRQGCIKLWFSPSPPSDGGEGWGEEARFI
jgi:hypothetical protein